jgi:LCP family protein required for cell wall assembly
VVAGLDTRGVNDDENTDVIMFSRVEVANKRVRTISIPRDLLSEIPGYGWMKINAAYNIGSKANNHDWNAGAALFRDTIEWNFNFKVDGIVTTNLHKMPGVIDAMGGITVVNPYDVSDDAYPTPDFGVKEIFYPAGELRLNGEQALEFSRTRHMDFDEGRVMRQQLVLGACLAELQKPENLTKLPDIVAAGQEFVTTDIPADVQGHLVANVPNIDPSLVEWGNVVELLWGEILADGGWNYMTDWTVLPVHVRGWLGVGYLDANRW